MVVVQSARLAVALVLLGFGALAVLKIPHGALWKPAVAATEWGHLLALVALMVLVGPASDRLGRTAVAVSVLAAALLLTPVIRAIPVAAGLPARFEAAFGPTGAVGAPFVLGGLLPASPAGPLPLTLSFPAADGSPLSLDLYLPAGPGSHPIVVTVHGGSWNSGDRTLLAEPNRTLAARGWAVAAIDYRLAPAHPFPAGRDDVLAAVRWLEANAGTYALDPDRIVLHGRSAGGHLVLSAATRTTDPAIRGVIALYPPTDMHWSWAHPGNARIIDTPGTLRQLLGGSPTDVPAIYDAASPIRYVGPHTVPTLLIHGGRDELVFPEQSRRLDEVLGTAGVPHLLVELPWGTHGTDANPSGPGGQISLWLTERFLERVTR